MHKIKHFLGKFQQQLKQTSPQLSISVDPKVQKRIDIPLDISFFSNLVDLAVKTLNVPLKYGIIIKIEKMDGIAYTSNKTVCISSNYLLSMNNERILQELSGVCLHELVHVFQYNGRNTAPQGLIEGIADFVRLKNNLSPPHWKRENIPTSWDCGYEKTAYFLEFISVKYNSNFVVELNDLLKNNTFSEKMFHYLTGKNLTDLWREYVDNLNKNFAH